MLALLGLATSAHADVTGDEDFNGSSYVFVSGGATLAYKACTSGAQDFIQSLGGTGSCNDKNFTYRVGYGYQFTRNWALEASWGQFGSAEERGYAPFPPPVGPGNYAWNFDMKGWALQAVVTLHMTMHTAVFAKFGVARVEYDESLDVQPLVTPPPPGYAGWYYLGTVNDKANNAALAAGFQIDTGPHGSIRFAAESYGSHNAYYIYGKTKPVRLVSGTVSLMWRY